MQEQTKPNTHKQRKEAGGIPNSDLSKLAALALPLLGLTSCASEFSAQSGVIAPSGERIPRSERAYVSTTQDIISTTHAGFTNMSAEAERAHRQFLLQERQEMVNRITAAGTQTGLSKACINQLVERACPTISGDRWVATEVHWDRPGVLQTVAQVLRDLGQAAAFVKFAIAFDGFKGTNVSNNSSSSSSSSSSATQTNPPLTPYNPQ